ncbi:hypothetical protein ASG52_19755 [Methylobacterium sp. Leaf456]|uniref:helix-turn-helix domain-containing protein n=1 Tax=Methylobacterium sp. Leaf456 TaxID=1736382 RepID=UPI0006FADC49|nr:helix-turn-helix transcriptional regulator [Methylobacterium sp. Leaf456]KQT59963.1 hypothetical protein ASG52_19755 [Methylobacterium sp. Leaf456]
MPRPVNPDDRAIGRRIYAARKRKGLPQREASVALEWAPFLLSEVERGTQSLSAAEVAKVARFFDIDPGFLLTGVAGRGAFSPREVRLVENYRRLTPGRREALERIVDCPEARTC